MKKKEANPMKFAEVLASLDREIAALRKARELLLEGDGPVAPVKRGRGRPRKVQPSPFDEAAAAARKR